MYPNPSADKFEPPSVRLPLHEQRKSRTRLVLLVVTLALSVLPLWLQSYRGAGWVVALAALAMFALMVAEFILRRKERDERDGTEPYTPPTRLTR